MLCFLTCGPLFLTLAAWAKLLWRPGKRPCAIALIALGVVSANAAFTAGSFVYYHFRPPSPLLPPWQDPEILNFGILFLLAPIGMILGVVAANRDEPKWLILMVETASIPMLLVGLFAGMAV